MINWNKKLVAPGVQLMVLVQTPAGAMERVATLHDARQILRDVGLDVTTSESVDWGELYPLRATHLTRICMLQQLIADLQNRLLGARARQGSL